MSPDDRISFIMQVMMGRATLSDIDKFVDKWHHGDDERELHQFLGMTEKEYGLWVQWPDILPLILLCHQNSYDIGNYMRCISALFETNKNKLKWVNDFAFTNIKHD